ncbi:uncharacterized membrane protein YebE (DUF533 family) [Sphingomonas zeicaulis]|uniref:hypothetical protein n=1 Tax=Sphingomonas zeicaulis TaxID=1632740 RepID=UPI003D259600
MLRRIMGAMVGGAIDRSDGKGGLKGAVIGAVAARAVSRAGPAGLAAVGAAVAGKMLWDRRKKRKAAEKVVSDRLNPSG